ncbi:MAG: hypothetical protein AAFM91_09220 [Pseudomonadota bacterium]
MTNRAYEPSGWLAELWLPLSPRGGLAAVLAFALLTWLAQAAGLLGIFLAWVLLFGFARHLIDVLVARAEARPWPVPSAESFNPFHEAWRFQIAILAFATLVAALVLLAGGFWQKLAAAVLLGALPANLALAAVQANPWRWFDLPAVWRLITKLGVDYLVLLSFCIGIVVLALFVIGDVSRPLGHVVETYALVFAFSSVGALLYRSRERLGLDVRRAPEKMAERADARVAKRWQDSLQLGYHYFSRGNETGGRTVLRDLMQGENESPELISWLVGEISQWENPRPLLLLAPRVIELQLERGNQADAFFVLEMCLERDAVFTRQFRNRREIADAASAAGRLDLADALLGSL